VNLLGKAVGRYRINPKEQKWVMDCSSLANGVYHVILTDGEKQHSVKKLVISK
jgi:hypothetical protein